MTQVDLCDTAPPQGAGPDAPFWRSRGWWRRVARTSLGLWLAMGLGFAGTVVAARGLGPNGYGTVVLALALATFVFVFLDLTLEEGVVHHGARALADDDMGRLHGLLRTALLFDLGIGLVVTCVVMAAAEPIANLGGGHVDARLVRLAALTPLATTMNGTTGAALLLAGRPDLRAWCMAGGALARVAAAAVAVHIGGIEALLVAFALAGLGGSALQGLAAWAVAWRKWARAAPSGPTPGCARSLLRFGIHTSAAGSLNAGKAALVPMVLGSLSGPSAVALLEVAMLPVSVAGVAAAPVRMALLPEQARLWASGRTKALIQTVRAHSRIGLALGVPSAVAGWFVLPWMMATVYSDAFAAAVWPARILLVAAVAQLAVGWDKTLPAAVGRPELRTKVAATEGCVVLALLVILAGLGPSGAAFALSGSALVSAFLWLWLAKRLLGPPADAKVLR